MLNSYSYSSEFILLSQFYTPRVCKGLSHAGKVGGTREKKWTEHESFTHNTHTKTTTNDNEWLLLTNENEWLLVCSMLMHSLSLSWGMVRWCSVAMYSCLVDCIFRNAIQSKWGSFSYFHLWGKFFKPALLSKKIRYYSLRIFDRCFSAFSKF